MLNDGIQIRRILGKNSSLLRGEVVPVHRLDQEQDLPLVLVVVMTGVLAPLSLDAL